MWLSVPISFLLANRHIAKSLSAAFVLRRCCCSPVMCARSQSTTSAKTNTNHHIVGGLILLNERDQQMWPCISPWHIFKTSKLAFTELYVDVFRRMVVENSFCNDGFLVCASLWIRQTPLHIHQHKCHVSSYVIMWCHLWYVICHQPGQDLLVHATTGRASVWLGSALGWIMTCSYVGSRIPQLVKNYRRGMTTGLSLPMVVLLVLGSTTYVASIFIRSVAILSCWPSTV